MQHSDFPAWVAWNYSKVSNGLRRNSVRGFQLAFLEHGVRSTLWGHGWPITCGKSQVFTAFQKANRAWAIWISIGRLFHRAHVVTVKVHLLRSSWWDCSTEGMLEFGFASGQWQHYMDTGGIQISPQSWLDHSLIVLDFSILLPQCKISKGVWHYSWGSDV